MVAAHTVEFMREHGSLGLRSCEPGESFNKVSKRVFEKTPAGHQRLLSMTHEEQCAHTAHRAQAIGRAGKPEMALYHGSVANKLESSMAAEPGAFYF